MEDPSNLPSSAPGPPSYGAFEAPRPVARRSRLWLHLLLFVATTLTVLSAGFTWQGTICVLAILLSHEMGHYLACRHYGIPATLPYFLPGIPPVGGVLPPIPLFGTFGAVIRIRGPIPDRRALFDVAAAGPLAGFAIALPVLVIGLLRATPVSVPPDGSVFHLGSPLISLALERLLYPGSLDLRVDDIYLAGWFGMLITSLNLFPVGQLDGGHAAYAISRDLHRKLARATILLTIGLTVVQGAVWRTVPSYALWCVVLLIMRDRHPRVMNEWATLDRRRKLIALALLILFGLSFTPQPFF